MPINSDEYSFDDDNILNVYNKISNNSITTNVDLDDETRKALDLEFEDYLEIEQPKKKRGRKPKNAKPESSDDELADIKLFIPSNYKNNHHTTKTINFLKTHPDPLFNPLTKEQEIEILNEWLDKDIDHLKYLLFCHHVKLVYSIAGQHFRKTNEFDDMVSRGYEGLVYAVNRFDFNRCLIAKKVPKGETRIKFSTYATFWIKKYVIWEFYKDSLNLSQKNISLDKVVSDGSSDGENGSATLENYISSKVVDTRYGNNSIKSVQYQVSCDFANEVIGNIYSYIENNPDKNFEKHDSVIFYRIFNENDTVKEISSDMNLSIAYINKRKTDIVRKVRDMLEIKYGITSINDIF